MGELRYKPYGETRYIWGVTRTDRRFNGQIEDAATGLYFYNARYYDPLLARFISADTIVPSPSSPQSLNRYSYVLNSPLNYRDPSGRCIPGQCPGDVGWEDTTPIIGGILFTADAGISWDVRDQNAVLDAVQNIGTSFRQNLLADRQANLSSYRRYGEILEPIPSAKELFGQVFGQINFHRTTRAVPGVWAETHVPVVTVYATVPQGRYIFQNAAHELGHAFAQRTGWDQERNNYKAYADLNAAQITYVDPNTNRVIPVAGGGWGAGYVRTNRGYALTNGATWPWQQNLDATPNEDFADMFLGWSYNHFANNAAGATRYQWMAANMPRWIALALTGTP